MSSPVVAFDIVKAARQFLAAETSVTSLLGSDAVFSTWLFQEKLYATVEGSEQCAVVLFQDTQWTSPNLHNTARFPRLGVAVYADPTRDLMHNTEIRDARSKILQIYMAIDQLLHMVGHSCAYWGGQRIVSCTRLNEPAIYDVSEADKMQSGVWFYAIVC